MKEPCGTSVACVFFYCICVCLYSIRLLFVYFYSLKNIQQRAQIKTLRYISNLQPFIAFSSLHFISFSFVYFDLTIAFCIFNKTYVSKENSKEPKKGPYGTSVVCRLLLFCSLHFIRSLFQNSSFDSKFKAFLILKKKAEVPWKNLAVHE